MFVIISCLNWFFGLWLFQKSSCWWATSSLNVLLIYRYCIILTTYLFSNKLHLCAKVLSWSFHYFVQSWQWHCTCILQHLLFMRSPTRLGSTASGLCISWLPCHHLLFHLFSLVSWNKFCLVTGSLGKRHNSHPRALVFPWIVIYHKWCLPDKKISLFISITSAITGMVAPWNSHEHDEPADRQTRKPCIFETFSNIMLYITYLEHVPM
jgi:hypothetical protein